MAGRVLEDYLETVDGLCRTLNKNTQEIASCLIFGHLQEVSAFKWRKGYPDILWCWCSEQSGRRCRLRNRSLHELPQGQADGVQ